MRPIASFDELVVGQEFEFGSMAMPIEEILGFARAYDPQPFHADPEAAVGTIFGGIIASGLHTLSAAFGHMLRSGIMAQVSMGGTGMDVRWPAPVRPGDEMALTARVEELTPSRSRPDRGVAKFRYTGRRVSDGVVVLEFLGTHFLKREDAAARVTLPPAAGARPWSARRCRRWSGPAAGRSAPPCRPPPAPTRRPPRGPACSRRL